MASGNINRDEFTDLTSSLTFNSDYIGRHESFSFYTNGIIGILQVNFHLDNAVSGSAIELVGNIPTSKRCFGALNGDNGVSVRMEIREGALRIDGTASTGWYNGNLVFKL